MAIYYIDPTASFDGDGSENAPFNTWDSVSWAYGNEYYQKAGTTWTETINIAPESGASNKSLGIIVGSYGVENDGRAILDGAGKDSPFVGIKINEANNCQKITIQDWEVKNISGTVSGNYGIQVYSFAIETGKHTIRNCYILDIGWNGIFLQKVNADVLDNIIEYTGDDCININNGHASDYMTVLVDGNTLKYPDQNNSQGDCVQFVDGRFSNAVISNNTMYSHTSNKQCLMLSGIDDSDFIIENNFIDGENICRGGISCSVARNFIVRNNIIQNVATAGGINAYNNSSEDADYVGPKYSYIHDNIIINCKYGITCSGASTTPHIQDIQIYNNTLVSCPEALRFYGRATITAKGNIIGAINSASGQALYVQSTIDSFVDDANIYWPEFTAMIKDYRTGVSGNRNTVAAYLAVAHPSSTSLGVDPLLDSNYQPADNSPCISNSAAKWWGNAARPTAINGEPRPDIYADIGAWQTTKHEFHPASILGIND